MRNVAFAPPDGAPAQTERAGTSGCQSTACNGEAGAETRNDFFALELVESLDGHVPELRAICGSLVVVEFEEVAVAEHHGGWLCMYVFRGMKSVELCGDSQKRDATTGLLECLLYTTVRPRKIGADHIVIPWNSVLRVVAHKMMGDTIQGDAPAVSITAMLVDRHVLRSKSTFDA